MCYKTESLILTLRKNGSHINSLRGIFICRTVRKQDMIKRTKREIRQMICIYDNGRKMDTVDDNEGSVGSQDRKEAVPNHRKGYSDRICWCGPELVNLIVKPRADGWPSRVTAVKGSYWFSFSQAVILKLNKIAFHQESPLCRGSTSSKPGFRIFQAVIPKPMNSRVTTRRAS